MNEIWKENFPYISLFYIGWMFYGLDLTFAYFLKNWGSDPTSWEVLEKVEVQIRPLAIN